MFLLRSSRPEVFLGKGVQKICSKFTGEHSCRCDFNKAALLYWNRTSSWVFFCKFPEYLQNTFPKNTSGWLLFLLKFFSNFNYVLNPSTRCWMRQRQECWNCARLSSTFLREFLSKCFLSMPQLSLCYSGKGLSFYKKRVPGTGVFLWVLKNF